MGPKTCVLVALNVAVLFALVSGRVNFPIPPIPPNPKPLPPPSSGCPRDAVKFAVCSGFVNGWNFSIGLPPNEQCCTAVDGLVNYEVAVCFCSALKANIFGFNLNIPIAFTNLINICSKNVPKDFICE